MQIQVKRIYGLGEKKKIERRILVDRLWPRGISKESAGIDEWIKEMTPSTDLRKWFRQDKEKNFKKFSELYLKELQENKDVIFSKLKLTKNTILVTAVKDIEESHIPTLLKFLNEYL
jgi:uncharacterized protein YeaO (DUF488 family)